MFRKSVEQKRGEVNVSREELKRSIGVLHKGKPVTALWIGEDGSMNAMPLSDILDQPKKHFLVDVPAAVNPDFEQAVQEMAGTDLVDPEEIIRAVHETQEGIIPPPKKKNGAGGKDGRRNDKSSGGQYRR